MTGGIEVGNGARKEAIMNIDSKFMELRSDDDIIGFNIELENHLSYQPERQLDPADKYSVPTRVYLQFAHPFLTAYI